MKTVLFVFLSFSFLAQKYKPFEGKLVYSIEMADTSLHKFIPVKTMIIYTNDTIVRIENETEQFGKQVIIKHTQLNKSILLLKKDDSKYAIQTDLSKENGIKKNDTIKSNLNYKKKFGKRKILDFKANRIVVKMKGKKQKIEILYLKQFSSKYTNAFEEIPGLPVRYYLNTEDGVVVYTLIYFEKVKLNRDLFGIPVDYKKVNFDQFLDEILKEKKE